VLAPHANPLPAEQAGRGRRNAGICFLTVLHLAALAILLWSEIDLAARAAFVLAWGTINGFWLVLFRRPIAAALLSLTLVVILILLSRFKHDTLMITVNFIDVMLVDLGTFSFLLGIMPKLAWKLAVAVTVLAALLVCALRIDQFRVRRSASALLFIFCASGLAALSFALPVNREDEFDDDQYVSKFVRSGMVAGFDLITRGVLQADPTGHDHLDLTQGSPCDPVGKLPHIVMVFDESSFDASMLPQVVLPPGYRDRFRSSDGNIRSFIVEGAGGPSWYTEYNVLAGLSVRSYGRFADSVTRLAAGRVKRGLPHALRRCGYSTYTLYSWFGAFAAARDFETGAGIEHFLDANQLHTGPADTDIFYYNKAISVISDARARGPAFVFVYLAANHFPWTYRYRPDLLPEWINRGNPFEIDEYLRRQELSLLDYAQFKEDLARRFPGEPFLLVRFGDHQPRFAKHFVRPGLSASDVARRIAERDPLYFTTYYAIEGVNFRPVNLSSALDPLDAPYLPVVVLEAAGVPLDASFAEQKQSLTRCGGLFYACADGAEARRFNRLLMDAGLIEGL
jgi:hypothetical protein